MVIDTSAFVAIIRDEPEARLFLHAILAEPAPRVAAPTLLELRIVVARRHDEALASKLEQLLDVLQVEIVAFGSEHLDAAAEGFARFGKGSGHEARLNFGDCFAYALAKTANAPLLFKGNDFSKTDVLCAVVS